MFRFLFKCMFLLLLLFIGLAWFAPARESGRDNTADRSGALDTIGAMRDTLLDLGNFCERKPQACETGKSVIGSIGVKARDGARFAYEFLDSKFGGKDDTQAQGQPADTKQQTEKMRQ